MKVFADTCVSAGLPRALVEADHDVVNAASWPADPGDAEVLECARQESRVLVTLGKDLGELAIVRGWEHAAIVRLDALSTSSQVEMILAVLERYGMMLQSGAIVTAEAGRVRVRPPDQQE